MKGKSNKLLGATIHKYAEVEIRLINNALQKHGYEKTRALCRHEEEFGNCKFSCVAEDDGTSFRKALGEVLGVQIKDISWTSTSGYYVGIVFD